MKTFSNFLYKKQFTLFLVIFHYLSLSNFNNVASSQFAPDSNLGSGSVTERGSRRGGHSQDYLDSPTGGQQHNFRYNCSRCGGSSQADRDAKKSYRLESIKADILRKLHLRAPPNITGRPLPDLSHIQHLIHKLSTEQHAEDEEWSEPDEERATTMKILQVSKQVPTDVEIDPSIRDSVCYFPFPMSEVRHVQQIVRLNLGIYLRPVTQDPRPSATRSTLILIYLLRPDGGRRMLRRRQVSLTAQDTGKWVYFRLIPSDIQSWLTHPESNYGILVESSNDRGQQLAVVSPLSADEEALRPYLEVETIDLAVGGGAARSRRAPDMDCDERSAERGCCRYPLEVDFASFKWDWIIVPTRYSAYYCSGECPYLYMQLHANKFVSHLARPSGVGGPCCSPRKVSSISMLYYDQYMNIVYGRLPGMVVDRCGCS